MALTTDPRPVAAPVAHPATGVATVDIAVPVADDADRLAPAIRRLHADLHERFPLSWRITIVDAGSTDGTWAVAQALVDELDGVAALHLDERGRGRALRAAWSTTASPVVATLDVALSTDLDALLPLVAPLVSGHSDLAIGSRLAPAARVRRDVGREVLARTSHLLVRTILRTGVTDARCPLEAVRRDVAERLLPEVEDEGSSFDIELLVRAERHGLRIHEVPVDGIDAPDAGEDLPALVRLAGRLLRSDPDPDPDLDLVVRAPDPGGLLVRAAALGLARTALFAVLFALLAGPVGPIVAAVIALATGIVATDASGRRLAVAARGRAVRLAAVGPPVVTLAVLAGLGLAGVTSTAALLVAATLAHAIAGGGRVAVLHAASTAPS